MGQEDSAQKQFVLNVAFCAAACPVLQELATDRQKEVRENFVMLMDMLADTDYSNQAVREAKKIVRDDAAGQYLDRVIRDGRDILLKLQPE